MSDGNRWAKRCGKCNFRYTWEGAMQADPGCPKCNPQPVRLTGVYIGKLAADVLQQCQEILSRIDEMPDHGKDCYGDSAAETVEGIRETIERKRMVSGKQQEALNNIQAGVEAWFHE
jgi:hypothetical protein